MNTTHHIPSHILAAYSAGTLAEAFSLVVACHLSLCDQCRADAAAHDVVGGAMLDGIGTAALSDDALAATLALIDTGPPPAATPKAPETSPSPGSVFPAPLQGYAGPDPDAVRWRRVGGGVRQAVLNCKGDAVARLLYIPSGTAVPDHGHNGLELTLVLQGAFSDHISRFARGDVELGDPGIEHTPVAEAGPPCICLAATDAPLKFTGLIPRLVQPFVGI